MKIFGEKPVITILPTPAKVVSIHEILSNPESLLLLSDEELRTLLAPYIPETRKALLPEEKPSKIGLHSRVMKDFLRDPKIAEQIEALRKAQKK